MDGSDTDNLEEDGGSPHVRDLERSLATAFDGSWCALEEVPDEIHECVVLERLILSNNYISSLPGWLFTINSLTEVDLSHNKLTSIPLDVECLKNLKKFNVSANRLCCLPTTLAHTFVGQLDISRNSKINGLDVVCTLPCLVQLCASYTLLSTIPSNISDLVHLEVLEARGNSMHSISGEIENLVELQTLDLGKNSLSAVPYELETLPRLEEVYLDENYLQILPMLFGKESRLRIANLSHNWIEACPEGIDLTPELSYLDLSSNLITIVPRTLRAMPKLTTLRLGDNPLVSVPVSLWQCPMLQELSFSNTFIDRVPPEIGGLQHLTSLFLDGCQLAKLPDEIGYCRALRILNLRKNKLSHIPSTVGDMENLRVLDLCKNRLTYLPVTMQQQHDRALWLHPNQRKALPDLQRIHVKDRDILVCEHLPQVKGMVMELFEVQASHGRPTLTTDGERHPDVVPSETSTSIAKANVSEHDQFEPAPKYAQTKDKFSTSGDDHQLFLQTAQNSHLAEPPSAATSRFPISSTLPRLQTNCRQSAAACAESQPASAEPATPTKVETGYDSRFAVDIPKDETYKTVIEEGNMSDFISDQVVKEAARKSRNVSFSDDLEKIVFD